MKTLAMYVCCFFAVLVLVTGCGGGGGGGGTVPSGNTNQPVVVKAPVADFNPSVTSGEAPLSVALFDVGTNNPTSWKWEVDNVIISTSQAPPIQVFSSPGTYSVKLTEANEAGSSVITKTIIVTAPAGPVLPRIKAVGFAPISNAERTENITVAVNDDFAASVPGWTQNAKVLFENYINSVFAKTNINKYYVVSRTRTYNRSQTATMGGDINYYYDNNFSTGVGGTTVFFYIYTKFADVPSQFLVQTRNGVAGNYTENVRINGKTFYSIWITNEASSTSLLGKSVLDSNWGNGAYESVVDTILHELGHALGLAGDEWYQYVFDDKTGVLPYLGVYDRKVQFSLDPMSNVWVGFGKASQFSRINSDIINANANHQYNWLEIMYATPAVIKFKVVDAGGNPVVGATVRTFGKTQSEVDMSSGLEVLTTDAGGIVQVRSDDWVTYVAKAIKALDNGKVAGMYLTLTDLEIQYIINGMDTVTYVLTLQ